MRQPKKVKWKNALGQEMFFDNRVFFCEYIDMTGTAGVHTVESLAAADGQTTTGHQLGAKTIPCTFAWKDRQNDSFMHRHLVSIFSSLAEGTMTVTTESDTYRINCYPQNIPVFKRDANVPYVWRWDVDFTADFPYWRRGTEQSVSLDSNATLITSDCPFDIPPVICVPANDSPIVLMTQHRCTSGDSWSDQTPAFTVSPRNYPVWIDVQTMKVTKADGTKCDQVIDVRAAIDRALISYGQNYFVCTGTFTSENRPTVSYYRLSAGEV